MKKTIRKVITAATALTLAGAMAIMPASAAYYSNSFAFDATGEQFAIPEAYRVYNIINIFDGGMGVLDSPSDLCFDKDGLLYVVDKDNQRVLIMDGDGVIKTIFGASMPDGVVEYVEDEEIKDDTADADDGIATIDDEPTVTDIIEDTTVRNDKLEKTDHTVEITELTELRDILSRDYMASLFKGTHTEGKTVENLTVRFNADFTFKSASQAAQLLITEYKFRYYYKQGENTEQETLSMNISFEVAEGKTLTIDTILNMGHTDLVNKGTIVVTSKGKLDISNSTLDTTEGELIQYYMGAIENTPASKETGATPSIAEGSKATYVVDEDYKVNFVYMYFKDPQGICVDNNGRIYICDTENRRLIHMAADYTDIKYYTEEMARAEEKLLDPNYNFTPSKVGISNTGMMYILNKSNYKGFYTVNKDGIFCGFVGSTKVTASVAEVLINIFGNANQKQQIANKQPAPAKNLYVVDNMIYGVVTPSSTEPDPKRIMKVNIVGSDLFPAGNYAITSYSTELQERVSTNYVDICVDDYGIVTVLDDKLGYIVQLNQLGEIIACFGGKSNRQGQFLLPTALDINPTNDRIYVADSLKGNIQVFEPTKFIDLVHEASDMYFEGLYSDAVSLWERVAEIDETYDLAHVGIAESLYGDGYNLQAMEKFEYAWNYQGYDKAFADFRLGLFRYYFAPIVLSLLALVILLAYGFVAIKRKSDDLYK